MRPISHSSKQASKNKSSSSRIVAADASDFGFPLGANDREGEDSEGLRDGGSPNGIIAVYDSSSSRQEDAPRGSSSGGDLVTAGLTMDGVGSTEHSRPFSIRGIRPVSGFQDDEGVTGAESLFISGGDILPPDLNQISAWASDVDTARQENSYVAHTASPSGAGNEPYYSSASIADLLAEINNSAF